MPISICALSQYSSFVKWPQIELDTVSVEPKTVDAKMQINASEHSLTSDTFSRSKIHDNQVSHGNSSVINIKNIQVHRNPEQVLITKNDQYACVRCFLSNTIEIIKISTAEILRSFFIPSPQYISISHDGTKLIVASLSSEPFPDDPPIDDCSIFCIGLNGKTLLTTIDLTSLEIFKTDTIKTLSIQRLLQSSTDSIIYLQGREVIEFDLANSAIIRSWPFAQQIWHSDIDNKNKRIFLTTINASGEFRLKVIDLLTGDTLSAIPYYSNGETAIATYIGMDTLSNRIFVQGKLQPLYSEILVFDAISLNQLPPIDSANMMLDCFLLCPTLGSIFMGAGFPENTMEVDYLTLERKKILPLPSYSEWHTLLLNNDKTRIFSFQYGSSEDALSYINPSQFLDVSEYDIKTGTLSQYNVTDQKYGCSYTRTLAATKDGRYIVATNSPANTISILELSHVGITEITISNVFEVHPNPTSGVITISLKMQFDSDYNIEIYNILGVLLHKISKTKSETNFTIDITKYPKGQYFLRINSLNQSYLRKVVKV